MKKSLKNRKSMLALAAAITIALSTFTFAVAEDGGASEPAPAAEQKVEEKKEEKKAEAKAEEKAEEKKEEKTESKAEEKTESKAEEKTEEKPEEKPELKTELKAEPSQPEEKVEAPEKPAATKAPVEFKGSVFIKCDKEEIFFGDEVVLRAVIKGTNCPYTISWQVNKGDGWKSLNEHGKTYRFTATEKNADYEYRVILGAK